MISDKKLLELGFEQCIPIGSGVKKSINDVFEICKYNHDKYLRFQSIGSGFTHQLKGIKNEDELKLFWFYMTGSKLT